MKFEELRQKFINVTKRVIQERDLSTNPVTLQSYRDELIAKYNALVSYSSHACLNSATDAEQTLIQKRLIKPKERLIKAFKKLNIRISFAYDDIFAYVILTDSSRPDSSQIDIDYDTYQEKENTSDSETETETLTTLVSEQTEAKALTLSPQKPKTLTPRQLDYKDSSKQSDTHSTNNETSTSSDTNSKNNSENSRESVFIEQNLGNTSKTNDTNSRDNSKEKQKNMVQTAQEAVKIVSQTITKNFDGNPLQLKAFLIALNVLDSLIEQQNKNLVIQSVLSKLEGKALECMPDDVDSFDKIKEILKKYIVYDNSKIIAGRMEALRADKTNLTEFTQKAESLADDLQRSLMAEGMTKEKALEMSVDKTIDMCRKSARTEIVKSVLASKTFATPKDVVATFIIQNATEIQEKKVLAYQMQSNRGNFRGNFRGNYQNNYNRGNFRGRYNGNRGNYSHNNRGNYYYNNNGNGYNNQQNRGNFHQNNYQRGNYRGGNSNRGNQTRSTDNTGNTRNIRAFEQTDNSHSELGFRNQTQISQEQVNSLPMNQINLH